MAEVQWSWLDGARMTPWMKYQIQRLDADFFKEFGYHIRVSSGVRLEIEQEAIFRRRYVLSWDVRGRRVYDTRWWNGSLWYRIDPAGTVAAPNSPQANHQIRGTNGAVDLRDTGPDAGIMTASSKRGRWIRANAWKYDLVAEGDSFGEGWHFKMLNVFKTPPGTPSGGGSVPFPVAPKGKTVIHHREDAQARKQGPPKGRTVAPGKGFYLQTSSGMAPSAPSNIVVGPGDYSIVTHVYAEGTPGDAVDVVLFWDDTTVPGDNSRHYGGHLVFGPDGLIRSHVPSIRGVAKNNAVYAYLSTPAANKGPVVVTLFDTDALQHP
jgi:hypothetical protein